LKGPGKVYPSFVWTAVVTALRTSLLVLPFKEIPIFTSMTPCATSLGSLFPTTTLSWFQEHASNPLFRLFTSTPVPNTSSLEGQDEIDIVEDGKKNIKGIGEDI
jgi:hypothetical protein